MTVSGRTPPLRSARLTLEPLRVAHAVEMFAGLRDPALYHHLPDLPPASAAALAALYRRISQRRPAEGADLWCNWIVRRDADRRCVGTVQATVDAAPERTGRVLIGYMVLPDFWRRGYGREAVAAMLDCLFGAYGCRVADALVDTSNRGSLALLAGLGFRTVGLVEDADFFAGAPSHDYELALDAASWSRRSAGTEAARPSNRSTRGQEMTS